MSKINKLTSALNLYQKYSDNTITFDDLERNDMHFRFKNGADMVVEETGLHTKNPFKLKVEDIVEWSKEQTENLGEILENQTEYFNKIKTRLETEITPTYKPYLSSDGYSENKKFETNEETLNYLKNIVFELRKNRDDFDAQTELIHRKKNIFDFIYFANGKNIDNPLVKTYLDDFTLTNSCTVLQSVKEEEPKESGEPHHEYEHKQRIYSIGEVIEMTMNPNINYRDKLNRPLVLAHTCGKRLVGDNLYAYWNGLQIFDIDLKFSKLYMDNPSLSAENHRDIIFNKLKHYPWLLGVTLSSSGRAVHVYTKVSRMHNLFDNEEMNAQIQKFWYRMSYIQKHGAIAYVLFNYCGIDDIYEKRSKNQIIDTSLSRVSQGIAINHDPNAKWSNNFMDLYPCFLYHIPPTKGIELEDWLLTPKILSHYTNWFYDFASLDETNDSVQINENKLKVVVDSNIQLDGISQIDMDSLSNGEKYSIRWRICNTVMSAFGNTEDAKNLCHHILQTAKTGKVREVNAFIRSAVINRKDADLSTIKTLKKLGVKIGIDDETHEEITDEVLSKVKFTLENQDYDFYVSSPDVNILLGEGEYIGMKMNEVINGLQDYKVNVMDSPPNTGKTEFCKALAKTQTVCLVLPFTSIIESKIVSDTSINELFDLYYGDISISDIKKGRSAVMTIDKFSMLPKSKYDMFDIICVDESHLLFTSVYRLPVVSQTIENIRTYLLDDNKLRQRLSNVTESVQNLLDVVNFDFDKPKVNTTKFILMSGTTTGELDYFKYYGLLNYIKIHKKHPHNKELYVNICKTSETRDVAIIKSIAEKIKSGGKVIHPTNKGDGYIKQIVRGVEYLISRELKYEYYKRANSDENFMLDINNDTTVNELELLFCSDYLSVGIDIKDDYDFDVVFSNDFTSESIEQFNNRLRSTNIKCKLFFDVTDGLGMMKPNIINTNHIQYKANDEFRKMIEDEKNIAMLQKSINEKQQYFAVLGEMFSKYFIEDFSGNIKYVKSAFEIEQFEQQYSIIARSLLYIKSSLVLKHQYEYYVRVIEEYSDEVLEKFEVLMKDAKTEHDINKANCFIKLTEFLGDVELYNILLNNKVVFIKDNDDEPINELYYGFDLQHMGGCYVVSYHKKFKYSIEDAKKFVLKMRKLYSVNSCLRIIRMNMRDIGTIKKIDIKRYMGLMDLMYDDKRNALSRATKTLIKTLYSYVDTDIDNNVLEKDDFFKMKKVIQDHIMEDYTELTNSTIQSQRRLDNINQKIDEFVDTIFVKTMGKETVKIGFRKILTFDSEFTKMELERDRIYRNILLNDFTDIDPMETKTLNKGAHVVESEADFV